MDPGDRGRRPKKGFLLYLPFHPPYAPSALESADGGSNPERLLDWGPG